MPGETSPARGIRINIRQSVSRFCELQRHLGSELWAPILADHPAVSRAQHHGDPYMEGRRIVCRCRDCWLCPNCSYRHAGWFVNDLEDDDDFCWSVWVIHRIRQAELVYLRHVVLSGFLRTDVGYGTFTLVLTGRKVLWQLRQGHVRFAEATGNGHQAALYAEFTSYCFGCDGSCIDEAPGVANSGTFSTAESQSFLGRNPGGTMASGTLSGASRPRSALREEDLIL